jgi:outer membrane protein assembly factor BamB
MTKHQYIIRTALIGALLLMHSANTTRANESIWPRFRGPNGSGHAAEGENPPIKFGPEQNVLWKTPVPSGHSSPCIWGDQIFLTGYTKEKKELQVFCIERSSGNIRWSRIVPAKRIEKVHPVSSPAASTPATDGELVYVYFASFGLVSYDFAGKQQWAVPLPSTKGANGHATSPIVSGELVILNRDDLNDPYLLAVDRRSGKTVWKQTRRYATMTSHATPIVWNEQLVIHRTGQVVAHSPTDGVPIWSVSIKTRGASTPVIGNNILFVGAWTDWGEPDQRIKLPDFKTLVKQYDKDGDMRISKNEFPDDLAIAHRPEINEDIRGVQFNIKRFSRRAFDRNKDGLFDETEWKRIVDWSLALHKQDHGLTAIQPGGKDNVTDTHILWQEKRNIAEVPSPLYYDGRVYMIKNGGLVSCMDAETGKLLYRERLGAAGLYCSSPICADGRIYIASGKGIITVFAAGDTLQILARNDLKEQIFSTPAVVENKLYVRTAKRMYAFGE